LNLFETAFNAVSNTLKQIYHSLTTLTCSHISSFESKAKFG